MRIWKNKGLETPKRFVEKIQQKGLQQDFFKPIVEGQFTPDQIETTLVQPGSSIMRSVRSENFIEHEWQRMIASGMKPWPNDLKPSRFRFVHAEVVNNKLRITLDPSVSYRDALGSRSSEFNNRFGQDYMPNPVAVTTVIRAKTRNGEEKVLLTLRSPDHDFKPSGYHISVGGLMDTRKETSPTETAHREVMEETGIRPEELKNLMCHGIVHHTLASSTEIIYEASTDVPVEEILGRTHDNENQNIFIPATASKLREWIIVPTHANVGVTNAAVLFVGRNIIRNEEGERAATEWYNDMKSFLAARSAQAQKRGQESLEERDIARLAVKVKSEKESGL